MTPKAAAQLRYTSDFWLRDNQIIHDRFQTGTNKGLYWRYYLIRAGRGFGKTKAGACWIKKCVSNGATAIAICGPTHRDVSQVMVPAIQAEYPPGEKPEYFESRGEIRFKSGAVAYCYSSETEIRGPNVEKCWCDEIAKWPTPDESLDTLGNAVRIGNPQILITTTPNRKIKILRKLQNDSLVPDSNVVLICGNTFDNAANLSPSYLADLEGRYKGSRLYRQEILGELLDDTEDALWSLKTIHDNRLTGDPLQLSEDLTRICVAVDPAGSNNPDSDETGIIVAGVRMVESKLGNSIVRELHGYVLEDASGRYSPDGWAKKVHSLYVKYGANQVVAEKNFGGDMVRATLLTVDPHMPITLVTASHGKAVRADPISAKYNQNVVHHVGVFNKLEDQMTMFTGGASTVRHKDDRLDAMVWALSYLMIGIKQAYRGGLHNLPNFS